jgi:hypothetical protein
MDFTAIQRALYTWFFDVTGFQVAWANQKRPQDDIVDGIGTLQITSITQEGSADEVRQREEAGDLYLDRVGSRLIVLNCQVATLNADFESHAMNVLGRAAASLRLDEHFAPLEEAGLSLVSIGALSDISAISGNQYQSRASFDVTFRAQSIARASVASGYFDKVQINNGADIGPPV